jgi:hypothetical protein
MTDLRARRGGRLVGLVTTGLVSLAAAAAIGWAAATPVGGSSPQAGSVNLSNGGSAVRTQQQVVAAQTNLRLVRRDLVRLMAREDDLPRASLANLPALVAQIPNAQLPNVQLPSSGGTVQPTTHAAPPITHTTTGASGASRP